MALALPVEYRSLQAGAVLISTLPSSHSTETEGGIVRFPIFIFPSLKTIFKIKQDARSSTVIQCCFVIWTKPSPSIAAMGGSTKKHI